MIVVIAYTAIFLAEIVDDVSYYYLACGFAYTLIALIAYFAAVNKEASIIPVVKIKSTSLLVAYSAVNLLAGLLNCAMVSKVTFSMIEPFYFDWPINYYSLLNFMDYLLIMAGLICVYVSSKSVLNYNNNSCISSFYNAGSAK